MCADCRWSFAGDHVAVYPTNDSTIVAKLGELFNVNLDTVISLNAIDRKCEQRDVAIVREAERLRATVRDLRTLRSHLCLSNCHHCLNDTVLLYGCSLMHHLLHVLRFGLIMITVPNSLYPISGL